MFLLNKAWLDWRRKLKLIKIDMCDKYHFQYYRRAGTIKFSTDSLETLN
jgi:hypothetical protein